MDKDTNNALYATWLEKEVNRVLEQDASQRPWSQVDKSKLPRQSFLWTEDPEKRSTWHLPYREGAGGIDPETGMYRQAGPVNLAALRAISAAVAGAQTGTQMNVPPEIKSKIKKLLKKYRIGTESIKRGHALKKIIEQSLGNQFVESRIDRESHTIRSVAILRPTSLNRSFPESKGRKYTETARADVARLANDVKSYIDHATQKELEDREGGRKVRDILGYFEHVKLDSDGIVRGDLVYLANHAEWIEPLVEQMADKIGNSIHAYGDIELDKDTGYEIVESIGELSSIDLVTDPGSTVNLFESIKKEKVITMEFMDIKETELRTERPDLIKSIETGIEEKIRKEMDTSERTKELELENKALREDKEKLAKEKDELEVKEKAREKEKSIQALVDENKIDKVFITKEFLASLRKADDETEIKALLEDRKKLVDKTRDGVRDMGDETDIDENRPNTDWDKSMDEAAGVKIKE